MGYYSDFRIMTTTEGRETLEDYVNKHTKEKEINLFNFLDEDKFNKELNIFMFGKDFIKFYPEFPEIENIIDGLNFLKKKNIPYCFIRIGENVDDIEYKDYKINNLPNGLYVERKIAPYAEKCWEERE